MPTDAVKVERERELSRSFVIDERSLDSLAEILRKHNLVAGQWVKLGATDDSETTYSSLEPVKHFTNSKVRSVSSLAITAIQAPATKALQGHDNPPDGRAEEKDDEAGDFGKFYLRLRSDDIETGPRFLFAPRSINYTLSGSDAFVLEVGRDLDEWLDQVRPGYSFIAEARFLPSLLSFLVFLVCGALLIRFLLALRPGHPSPGVDTLLFPFTFGLLGSLLSTIFVPFRPLAYMFPLGMFTFGVHGADRAKRRDSVRTLVWSTIFLGLTINLIASVIYGWGDSLWRSQERAPDGGAKAIAVEAAADGGDLARDGG